MKVGARAKELRCFGIEDAVSGWKGQLGKPRDNKTNTGVKQRLVAPPVPGLLCAAEVEVAVTTVTKQYTDVWPL